MMMMVMSAVNFALMVAAVYLGGVDLLVVVVGAVRLQVALSLKELMMIAHLKNHREEVKSLTDLYLERVLMVNYLLLTPANSLIIDRFHYHQSLAEKKSLMNYSFHFREKKSQESESPPSPTFLNPALFLFLN